MCQPIAIKRRLIPIHLSTVVLIVGLCCNFIRLNAIRQDRSDAFWNSAELGMSGGNGYGWPYCFSWMGCFGPESHGSYFFVDVGIALLLVIVAACSLEAIIRKTKPNRTWFQFSLGTVLMCFIAVSALLCLNMIPHETHYTGQTFYGWPFRALDSMKGSEIDAFYLQKSGVYKEWGVHIALRNFILDALLFMFSPFVIAVASKWWRRRNTF